MASSNIIAIPFRRGAQLTLSASIKQYISAKYDQHPDMFRQDLEVVDALRRDAVNVREAHPSGVKKLQAYAAQLVWMGGKFPIDIGADFTWYPALGYNLDRPVVRNNLKYELLNVLFNLAALYSQLAISSATNTSEGLKSAANHFRLAAGVLQHMVNEVLPELRMSNPPEDMDAYTLGSLAQLCLAQAQWCYYERATKDSYKDGLIGKLAAAAADLYDAAGEQAVHSDAISSAWLHHMSAKQHWFAAVAQSRTAMDCLEKKRYGEEIARLRDALNCVSGGLQDTRQGRLTGPVVDDLNRLKRKVEGDLQRAERDNDMVYLNPVPPKTELKRIDRASMATAQTPPQVAKPLDHLGDKADFGAALFTRLVPFSVHQATSIYEERRDRLVNQNIIHALDALTDDLHAALASLGLPGSLQALEKPLGLPHSLTQHADQLRQAEALTKIEQSIADIDKLRAADREVFDEGLEVLAAEEEEDNRLRAKYGAGKWRRVDSAGDEVGARLRAQATEIEGYFETSGNSDALVREKYAAVRETLALLAGPERGLMAYVPSSMQASVPEGLKAVIGRLRGAYNDVLRLESRRRRRVDALRDKSRGDDIRPDIMREAARLERTYPSTTIAPEHFETFFEKRLDRLYESELEALEKEGKEQERLLGEVSRVNREFESQKRMREGDSRVREERLQALEEAFRRYEEIVGNLEDGRKFYNDLSGIVGRMFRDQARGWANQRRMEARSLEEDIALPPLSTLNISRPVHSPPQDHAPAQPAYQPAHQQQEPEPEPEAAYQSWADETVAPAQPRPVAPVHHGMWTPDAGIKFASREGSKGGTWEPSAGIRFS